MRTPSFSVVIPLHNKEPHIGRTVQTVLKQCFKDFELIIVDDASNDGSVREVKRFNDPRIRLLHRTVPGPGGYAARNLGIRSARADWISLIDADDTWDAEYLEYMGSLQRRYPQASLLCCGWRIQKPDGRVRINPYTQRFEKEGAHLIDILRFLRCSTQGSSPMCASVVTMRRALLLAVGGFPEGRCRRGGDIDTWLRAMLSGAVAAWYPAPAAVYHQEAGNRVTQHTPYDLNGACAPNTVRERLRIEKDPGVRRELKLFSNHYQILGVKRRVKSGVLSPADVRMLYRGVEPLQGILYSIIALLPGWAQRAAASLYGRIF